jgi:hypothetical protein
MCVTTDSKRKTSASQKRNISLFTPHAAEYFYITIVLIVISFIIIKFTDPGGRAGLGVSLLQLDSWDCGFETRRGQGCLSLLSVVCSQVYVSGLG